MLKVNDFFWATDTDPENKYMNMRANDRRKAKPTLRQNPRKAKNDTLSIRIKLGGRRFRSG